jgi:glycosyltransferase involved in cell wall biosynthesis
MVNMDNNMKNNVEVSVVLPCLNEEKAIEICLKKIKEVFARDQEKLLQILAQE